jgi:hypothetical protein
VYYVVTDSSGDPVRTVEADFADEAVHTVEADGEHDGKTLHAREAEQDEAFRYLVNQIGLSYIKLGERLDVSENYIGYRMRGDRDVRRLDVLALERFRQLQERSE